MSNSECLTHSLAILGLSVYNPSISFATPPEVRSIFEQARSANSKAARQFHCSAQETQVMVA